MKPKRYNWPDTPMMDMSPGSPWILHAVDHIKKWFPTTHAKGIFLDVVGERLWSGAWNQMSAAERATWTAGNRDFVHRLRVAMGPNVIIVANNIWANGNPELNGITVEHHSFSEAPCWRGILGRSDWAKPTRNMVIANSTSNANSWAGVSDVTHISAQSSYGGPAAPIRPFSPLPGTGTGQSPAPTPPPDPTPTPTPPPSEPDPGPAPGPPASNTILTGNLLANPSFESTTTGWGSWQGAVTTMAITGAPDGAEVAQVRFGGSGSSYTIGDFPGRVTVSANGAKYIAQAYVRSGSSSTVGKPVTLFLRERTAGGATVQQVHGVTRTLTNGFQVVTASITARTKGDKIDVFAAQDRASAGNLLQVDSISMAPLS